METLGALVDKLTIVNLKLWHVQDRVYAAEKAGQGLDAETTKKLTVLNLERSQLITEVDQLLDRAVRSGQAPVDYRVKIT